MGPLGLLIRIADAAVASVGRVPLLLGWPDDDPADDGPAVDPANCLFEDEDT